MNHITVIGNIGEPKMSFTAKGTSVLTFGLATNRKVGEEKYTTWHNIKVFAEFADNLFENISKGDRLMVIGRLETETWTDKDGHERKSIVVIAEEAGPTFRWTKTTN